MLQVTEEGGLLLIKYLLHELLQKKIRLRIDLICGGGMNHDSLMLVWSYSIHFG